VKAMVLHEWGGTLNLEEVPIPKVGPEEALIKVRACGIGLTLKWIRAGNLGGSVPRIIGHEIAGEVVEIGSQVTNVKVGERVCVYFYLTCGICEFCRKNRETLCRNFRGYVGTVIDGGYAEYVKLPEENLFHIPDQISFEEASIIPDAIGTPLHALRERAQVKPLDNVMVVGAGGGVGIHAVQIARLCGGRVIAVDISELKLEKTKELGADAVINGAEKDFAEEARRLTEGKGVDAIIDFVCTADTAEKGFRSLNTGGRLVFMAAGGPGAAFTASPRSFFNKELVVTGGRCCTKQELTETIEIVKQGRIKSVVTQTFSLEEAELAHRLIDENKIVGRAVMVMSG